MGVFSNGDLLGYTLFCLWLPITLQHIFFYRWLFIRFFFTGYILSVLRKKNACQSILVSKLSYELRPNWITYMNACFWMRQSRVELHSRIHLIVLNYGAEIRLSWYLDFLSVTEAPSRVYKEKLEALKALKKYKTGRMKTFNSREEAEEYARNGGERSKCLIQITSPTEEKSSNFKGPKPQELVSFRKLIESGDLEAVKNIAWENPRYLVSSGDTPAILQASNFFISFQFFIQFSFNYFCSFKNRW